MNLKTLCTFIAASFVFCSAVFGDMLSLSGRVLALTDSQITLKSDRDTWVVARTQTTTVTSGKLAVGSVVAIQCVSTDAHKNE